METVRTRQRFDLTLYTIGHSNRSLDKFIELLHRYDIRCLIDVRSVPYSSYHQDFRRDSLQCEIPRQYIEYRWMGDTLGGKRKDLTNSAGIRMDDSFNADSQYRTGLVDLMGTALRIRTAIMCSEEDPRDCHRHKIIADSLLRRRIPECHKLHAITVLHIRGNGHLENAANVIVTIQGALPI